MILFAAYRDWAISAINRYDPSATIVYTNEQLKHRVDQGGLGLIIFCGWSEIIGSEIYETIECWCYHPSSLPKYRGGSPIQNQIISGVVNTNGSIFRLTDVIDGGDIVWQEPLDLSGDLASIFKNISENMYTLLRLCLAMRKKNKTFFLPQSEKYSSYFSRRKPEQSRISKNELARMSGKELYNFVRCLQHPYPQAYIQIDDYRFYLDKCEKNVSDVS